MNKMSGSDEITKCSIQSNSIHFSSHYKGTHTIDGSVPAISLTNQNLVLQTTI